MKERYFPIYFEIAFNNGLYEIFSSYLNNKELLENGFEYLSQHDYYLKDEMVIDEDQPVFEMTIIDRPKFLQRILDKEKKEFLDTIKKEDIKVSFDELLSIYDKIETLVEKDYFEIVINHLNELIKDVKVLYAPKYIEHHKIFNKIKELNSSLSYFQCLDLPYSFYEELYEVTYILDLIDDVIVSETDFIGTLIVEKGDKTNGISFIKSNPIVAHYLREIEPFFKNFNATTIESSGLFFNKQGKPLKSSDLYAALSRGKSSNQDKFNRISKEIETLKNTYLK
ncbi:DUF6617 family protein [Mangrovimonas futianensis]|uniref:DUF6617 family protein n=1 Tax=Mangrovimonas futianensis TaxID=2895523 RepID=UPI001E4877C9|nr:DUF6617 family protein [Mangrovimonas futianensis]MCF1420847.1 hypothetical protein [Mangrovimonas futianensis]